jgi:hypothetical protein
VAVGVVVEWGVLARHLYQQTMPTGVRGGEAQLGVVVELGLLMPAYKRAGVVELGYMGLQEVAVVVAEQTLFIKAPARQAAEGIAAVHLLTPLQILVVAGRETIQTSAPLAVMADRGFAEFGGLNKENKNAIRTNQKHAG